MKGTALVAAFLALAAPSTAVAQLCLGRSLPGEGSITADMALFGDGYATRFAAGAQLGNGLAWRIGVIGGAGEGDPWSLDMAQGELSHTLPSSGGLRVCPGLSVVRTLPSLDPETFIDGFVSFSVHRSVHDGTAVAFVTPRVIYRSGVSTSTSGYAWGPEVGVGLTAGVGVLVGPFSVRSTLNLIGSRDTGMQPVLGLGIGVRGVLPGRDGAA